MPKREKIDNGLWGVKGDLKRDLEGTQPPVWLETKGSSSTLSDLRDFLKGSSNVGEYMELVVNPMESPPERVNNKMSDWIHENCEPDRWLVRFRKSGDYKVDQQSLSLVVEY